MNAAIEAIEIETVDNLNEETAASGKALDAHQGFVLAGQIEGVQDATDNVASVLPRDLSTTWVRKSIGTIDGDASGNEYRISTDYVLVKNGDTFHVNPNGHYVGIYLYNQDKTSALGAYAVLLTGTEYDYTCPQDGWVKFIESKTSSGTTQKITLAEQYATIRVIPSSEIVMKPEFDVAMSEKADIEVLANIIDWATLPIQIGYPLAGGTWNVPSSGTIPYHKVVKRTSDMKKFKLDAQSANATRYVFFSDYHTPQHGDACYFIAGQPTMNTIPAGTSTGWVDIPDECNYIILIRNNAGTTYVPQTISVVQDKTEYNTKGMRVVDNSSFVQGTIKTDTGQNNGSNIRGRTNAYYKVSEGDEIIFDYQEKKLNIYVYDTEKVIIRADGWLYERKYVCDTNGYVRFTIANMSGTGDPTASTFNTKIYIPQATEDEGSVDWKDEYTDRVADVARPPRVSRYPKSKMLTLLHFSDLHIDRVDEMQRIMDFYNANSSKIDDILNTGDLQDADFGSGIANFLAVNGHERVLNVIGNHDVYKSGTWSGSGNEVNVYNRFIKDFVSSWGVVQPTDAATNGLNYWYKDYTDTTSYTTSSTRPAVPRSIRLIALDCMYWTTAQNTWLQDVLSSTPNTMSVIVACHYKPSYTRIECNMDDGMQESIDYGIDPNADPGYVNAAAVTSVKNFIDGGGKFICWLCGHDHKDYMGLATADNRQLVIGVSLAQCGARTNYSVMDRIEGTKSQDLFNIIGFDTYNKHIRILRIGADFDIFMRSKKSLCINYETKAIISQT